MPADPKRIDHALALAAEGNPGEAETLLEHLAVRERDPGAAWHLAWMRLRNGDAPAALALLMAFPDDPTCSDRAREHLIGERRNDEAVAFLKLAPELPTAPRGLVTLAIHQHLAKNYAGAAASCRKALELAPAYAPAHNHLGRALHNLGDTAGALASFERAVHADPRYPEAWHNLAHTLRARSELERSCEALQRSLALSPGYRSARLNLGINLFTLDRPEPALACFEALLARNRDDVDALVNSGLCMQLMGQGGKARQRFERALELAPDHQWAHYFLGALLLELGEPQAAKKSLQQALMLWPADPDAWAELAAAYRACGEPAESERAIQTGLSRAPQHGLLNVEAARLERRRGDSLGAEARLSRVDAGRMLPRLRQRFHHELGRVLDRNGRSEPAFEAFVQANTLARATLRWRKLDTEAPLHMLDEIQAWLEEGAPGIDGIDDGDGDQGEDLCFQFGFPHSDPGLLEDVLAHHPAVCLIRDKSTLEQVVNTVAGLPGGYPTAIARLDRSDRMALRRMYRLATSRHGAAAGKTVIDLSPLRSPHAGLVQALFPKARLLQTVRHPCEVVLANFMGAQSLGEAGAGFLTLEGAVRRYEQTFALWWQLQPRLTLPLAVVRYETLVASPQAEVAAVCDFLGLAVDADGLAQAIARQDPERLRNQRRPQARWERYRVPLQPWLARLEPHATRLGYRIG